MSFGKMLSSFFNPGKGYEKAQNALEKYYRQGQSYLQPYNQHGQEAYGNLSGAMEKLLNPAQLYDEFAASYQPSEYARLNKERALNDAMRAASSMGMVGSTPALQAIQGGLHEIDAQDQMRYIENLINQYLQGANIAQGIYGQGANMAGQMGQNALNFGNTSAEMAYGKQNAPGQLFGNLLGTGANLAGAYMGYQGMNKLADAWRTKV